MINGHWPMPRLVKVYNYGVYYVNTIHITVSLACFSKFLYLPSLFSLRCKTLAQHSISFFQLHNHKIWSMMGNLLVRLGWNKWVDRNLSPNPVANS